jgi:hypothetical protein
MGAAMMPQRQVIANWKFRGHQIWWVLLDCQHWIEWRGKPLNSRAKTMGCPRCAEVAVTERVIAKLREWMLQYPDVKCTGEWWAKELDRLVALAVRAKP